jgi:hypothetical protein
VEQLNDTRSLSIRLAHWVGGSPRHPEEAAGALAEEFVGLYRDAAAVFVVRQTPAAVPTAMLVTTDKVAARKDGRSPVATLPRAGARDEAEGTVVVFRPNPPARPRLALVLEEYVDGCVQPAMRARVRQEIRSGTLSSLLLMMRKLGVKPTAPMIHWYSTSSCLISLAICIRSATSTPEPPHDPEPAGLFAIPALLGRIPPSRQRGDDSVSRRSKYD